MPQVTRRHCPFSACGIKMRTSARGVSETHCVQCAKENKKRSRKAEEQRMQQHRKAPLSLRSTYASLSLFAAAPCSRALLHRRARCSLVANRAFSQWRDPFAAALSCYTLLRLSLTACASPLVSLLAVAYFRSRLSFCLAMSALPTLEQALQASATASDAAVRKQVEDFLKQQETANFPAYVRALVIELGTATRTQEAQQAAGLFLFAEKARRSIEPILSLSSKRKPQAKGNHSQLYILSSIALY